MIGMAPRAALLVLMLAGGSAAAQVGRNYDITPLNFDLWCQQTAHVAPDRCDKRLPDDEAAFEAYRAKMDAYEIEYLKQKNKDARIETDILHNDPTDRSATRALQAQSQQGNTPVRNDSVP